MFGFSNQSGLTDRPEQWAQSVYTWMLNLIGISTKTASYTIEEKVSYVRGDATAGAISITVPPAAQRDGQRKTVVKIDSSANAVTVSRSSSDTFSGATSIALSEQWDAVSLRSNGNAGWEVTSRFSATNFAGWLAFTPSRTGWTDVGSPAVTGRYRKIGNICFFQVKVVPGTTTATVAGTSYVSFPLTVGSSAIAGDASMMNLTTLVAVGDCAMDVANGRCYVPTQGATGNTLTIAGWFEV